MNTESSSETTAIVLRFDVAGEPFLIDHAVQGLPVLSGASMLVGLYQADRRLFDRIESITFQNMLALSADAPVTLSVRIDSATACLTDSSGRTVYAELKLAAEPLGAAGIQNVPLPELPETARQIARDALYTRLARQGNNYGPAFQGIASLVADDGQLLATWDGATQGHQSLVTLVDSCTHLVAACAQLEGTYVLKSAGRITLADESLTGAALVGPVQIAVAMVAADEAGCKANCTIYDANDRVIAQVSDLALTLLDPAALAQGHVAVAGSFTLDPLADSFDFWGRELGLSLGLRLADYGQVFQELLGGDGVFDERSDAHVVFLRMQDWIGQHKAASVPEPASLAAIFDGLPTHTLADGRHIAHLNKYETEYLYREIFVDFAYRRHGVGVLEGDTVIDIGANIGMFSLFAASQADAVRVIAVEPSPSVLPMLQANVKAYSPASVVVAAGASNAIGQASFTAYPNSSVFSTFASDQTADRHALGAIIRNTLVASGHVDPEFLDDAVDELLDDRLKAENYDVPLISVSDIIRQQGVTQIGLLKIDAEKSEDAILAGIDAEHWPMIEQIIIEVHTQSGAGVKPVSDLLASHGFESVEDEEQLLTDSGLVTLYATRPERRARVAASAPEKAVADSANLYLQAVDARAARGSTKPLLTVICPPATRDPLQRASLDAAQAMLIDQLNHRSAGSALTWTDFARRYPVAEISDDVSNQLGHIPYTPQWYAATATALVRWLLSHRRTPYKVLALDCDNTLWSGVVGEVGANGITLDPGHLALQRFAKEQAARGVLVCLVSKNAELDVLSVFEQRSDMLLSLDDCVARRINWTAKSGSLIDLAAELNLGLDSFVFLDDSPVECGEVRANCPEILTLQLPQDPARFADFLEHVWAFDDSSDAGGTSEDQRRVQMYKQEGARDEFRREVTSLESFIEGLALDVRTTPMQATELARVSQLTNRTNQFNLTTIRRSPEQLEAALSDGMKCHVLHVTDRFGDYGLTGVVMFSIYEQRLLVDTLLLSCRVLGRGVEHALIAHLGRLALDAGASTVVLPFAKTSKNEPALRFLETLPHQGKSAAIADSASIVLDAQQAADVCYTAQTVNAAADAVAGAARPELPPAPSELVERVARDLNTVAAILERASLRTRLPRPTLANAMVPARTDFEKTIAAIWCDTLGLEEVGVEDNFFELGGTSLRGVEMVARLQKVVATRVAVVDLFDARTIRALSRIIEGGGTSTVSESKDRGAARRAQRGPRRRTRG